MFHLLHRHEALFVDLLQLAEKGAAAAALLSATIRERDPSGERLTRIEELEQDARKLRDEALKRIGRRLVTSIDREDLHDLVASLGAVLDRIRSVARRLQLYQLETLPLGVEALGQLVGKATATIVDAVQGLGGGLRYPELLALCDAIEEVEHDSDSEAEKALAALFVGGAHALDVVKGNDLLADLERTTDRCRGAADALRRIVLKNA